MDAWESSRARPLVLRTERRRRGWSQTRVSGLTGIAQADLSGLERGRLPAYPGWRRRLAQVFDMAETELFAIEGTE